MGMEIDFIETSEVQIGHLDPILKEEINRIPDRISFKIGEVASLLEVKSHVLRYWEMEFELLRPKKMSNGQRLYFKRDVETAFLIKKLLYKDGFSIKGAKQALGALKEENRVYKKQNTQKKKLSRKFDLLLKKIHDIRETIK